MPMYSVPEKTTFRTVSYTHLDVYKRQTGITPDLNAGAKLILITTMFIGRLGPLTMATVWSFKPKAAAWYSEESITIG